MADQDPSPEGTAGSPSGRSADGLLGPLAATTGLLGVLLLWARTHEQSCLALAAPALIYLAVFWGLLEHRLERRRFAVHYYLDAGSPWRGLFRRWWLPAATSLLAALPLAVLLSVFAALARATDWLFLAGAAVLAPLLFNGLAVWPGRHFRRTAGGALSGEPAAILTSRLAGHVLLAAVVLAYVHLNYSVIPGPPNVHGDPLATGAAFAAQVRSACPVVEAGLRTAAWFDGAAWSIVQGEAEAISRRLPDGIMTIVWAGLFLNAALAMTGFVRGLEGVNLLGWRVASRMSATDAGAGSAGTPVKRRTAGVGRAVLVIVPLTVLAAVGWHGLQLRVAERWSVETPAAHWPQFGQAIDGRVEAAFAPVYATIPGIVDRYYSVAGWLDPLTPLVGQDQGLLPDLGRAIGSAREAVLAGVDRDLSAARDAQLARWLTRELDALPSWLRGGYAWLLEPVHARFKARSAMAVHYNPKDILREMERAAAAADYAARVAAVVGQIGGTVLEVFGLNQERQLLSRELTAIVDAEKKRLRERLLTVVETELLTPRKESVPSRLRPASR